MKQALAGVEDGRGRIGRWDLGDGSKPLFWGRFWGCWSGGVLGQWSGVGRTKSCTTWRGLLLGSIWLGVEIGGLVFLLLMGVVLLDAGGSRRGRGGGSSGRRVVVVGRSGATAALPVLLAGARPAVSQDLFIRRACASLASERPGGSYAVVGRDTSRSHHLRPVESASEWWEVLLCFEK